MKIWADRTKSDFIGTKIGADAAGLAFDAFQQAKANKSDVLIIDTAGRLQNKAELMAELEKIVRVLGKLDPDAPHTVLQTLDATTGQNALNQVEIFRNVAGVNGLIMTKLDGTARGGLRTSASGTTGRRSPVRRSARRCSSGSAPGTAAADKSNHKAPRPWVQRIVRIWPPRNALGCS